MTTSQRLGREIKAARTFLYATRYDFYQRAHLFLHFDNPPYTFPSPVQAYNAARADKAADRQEHPSTAATAQPL